VELYWTLAASPAIAVPAWMVWSATSVPVLAAFTSLTVNMVIWSAVSSLLPAARVRTSWR